MARAPVVPRAEDLRDRISFQVRAETPDDLGNPVAGDFAEQFVRSAKVQPLRGGEAVTAARLEERQPVLIFVRSDENTRRITNDWRAVDARSGSIYEVKTAEDMERRREWVTLLCESGVAA